MRYKETRWKENLCNSLGSMLWSLFNRNNNKEAKVYARGSKYQSVTPCSYFLNQASFRQTSLISTNESCLDEWVLSRRMSLVSTNESCLDEMSLVSTKWVLSRRMSLVLKNESRFEEQVSFRQTSLYSRTNKSCWKSFIEWLINRDDLKLSGFPETVSDPNFFWVPLSKI